MSYSGILISSRNMIIYALLVDNIDSRMATTTTSNRFLSNDSTNQQLELLRRQYFQLWDPHKLTLPSRDIMRLPEVQASIFESMFGEENLNYTPPDRYKIRVLKRMIYLIEKAIVDPEEDVCFPYPRGNLPPKANCMAA